MLRERQEPQDARAPGERLPGELHEREWLRPGEPDPAEGVMAPIGPDLQVGKQLGSVLHLVDHDGRLVYLQEQLGIFPRERPLLQVVERDKAAAALAEMLEQRGLARLARTRHEHDGKLPARRQELVLDVALDVFHLYPSVSADFTLHVTFAATISSANLEG